MLEVVVALAAVLAALWFWFRRSTQVFRGAANMPPIPATASTTSSATASSSTLANAQTRSKTDAGAKQKSVPRDPVDLRTRPPVVLYGTLTGTAQGFAQRLAAAAKLNCDIDMRVMALEEYKLSVATVRVRVCLFVCRIVSFPGPYVSNANDRSMTIRCFGLCCSSRAIDHLRYHRLVSLLLRVETRFFFAFPAFLIVSRTCSFEDELARERLALIIVPTYEGGKPNAPTKAFYDFLADAANDFRVGPAFLHSVNFAVFSLGDSVYGEHFGAVGRDVDAWMRQLGAQRMLARGVGDAQYSSKQFDAWMLRLWPSVSVLRRDVCDVARILYGSTPFCFVFVAIDMRLIALAIAFCDFAFD